MNKRTILAADILSFFDFLKSSKFKVLLDKILLDKILKTLLVSITLVFLFLFIMIRE